MTPFVKWAGGKGQLLDKIQANMPAQFGRYYEPFVGGGAVLFSVVPQSGCINDINEALIHTYRTIKFEPKQLIAAVQDLDRIPCSKDSYMAMREEYNSLLLEKRFSTRTAALFIFLNKHCFNGLYRVNRNGAFNVPWNNKTYVKSISTQNIMAISSFLQGIDICCGDFEDSLKDAGSGDFIFIDSPYAPISQTSFDSYTKDRFSEAEHRRLARLFREMTERGCFCMATNHDTELIRSLYSGFDIKRVDVRRSINSDAGNRKGTEIIIRNYAATAAEKST